MRSVWCLTWLFVGVAYDGVLLARLFVVDLVYLFNSVVLVVSFYVLCCNCIWICSVSCLGFVV